MVDAEQESISYGAEFRVGVFPAEEVNRAVLFRPAAVIHSVEMNKRSNRLS